MNIEQIEKIAVEALEDIKGQNIVALNTESLSPMFERVIIVTGTSTRQLKALVENVADKLREVGIKPIGIEGEQDSEWVLIDFGALVVHAMLPEIRDYYRLEEIWQTESDVRFTTQYEAYHQTASNA